MLQRRTPALRVAAAISLQTSDTQVSPQILTLNVIVKSSNKHVILTCCNGFVKSSPNLPLLGSRTDAPATIPNRAVCIHWYRQCGSAPPPVPLSQNLIDSRSQWLLLLASCPVQRESREGCSSCTALDRKWAPISIMWGWRMELHTRFFVLP